MGKRPYYGVIGNGETCAFISPVGNIEWLCLPQFDGQVVYSKAISRLGGSLDFQVNENGRQLLVQDAEQNYVENTAVLKTRLKFKSLAVGMTDFMPWPEPEATDSEKRMMFKIVDIRNTSRKPVIVSLKVRSSAVSGKFREVRENKITASRFYAFAITFLGNRLENIRLGPRETKKIPVILVYGKTGRDVKNLLAKKRILDPGTQLKKCTDFWFNWMDKGKKLETNNKDYKQAYYNSLVAMKLLNFEKTGAMLAAATTSLPASPIGTHSWDYRFVWIRDAYYACRALLATGHYEEVKRQLSFLYDVQEKSGHWSSPFYTIGGKVPGEEIDIDLGGEILRLNNAAKNQLQLDSEGSVLYLTYLYFLYSKDIEFLQKNWENIKSAAGWVARNCSREENGIWEFRNKTAHWTYGKTLCYAGIDAAIKIAGFLNKKAQNRWIKALKVLKKEIVKKSWSDHRNAFLQTYGKDSAVDISVLALEDYGLVAPFDRKISATVKLIENKLNLHGGIKRNEDAQLPFYFATLWLAAHYQRTGDKERASEIIKICIDSSTDLYLYAEHFDALNKMQYGNFPQTFNASMLIERILEIENKEIDIEKIFNMLSSRLRKAMSYNREDLVKWSEEAFGTISR